MSDASIDSSDIDMSPEAIGRRLEEVSQLYELGQHLQQAKPIGQSNAQKLNENAET